MKKAVLTLILLCFAFAFMVPADSYVLNFRVFFKGEEFRQLNTGNVKKFNQKKGYLVMKFDTAAFTFAPTGSNVMLVTYWMEDNNKFQYTEVFAPALSVEVLNAGQYAVGTVTQKEELDQNFQTLISTRRLSRVTYLTEGEDDVVTDTTIFEAIPTSLYGCQVYNNVDTLGQRFSGSTKIFSRLNRKWTLSFYDLYYGSPPLYTIENLVSILEQNLLDYGYKKYESTGSGN